MNDSPEHSYHLAILLSPRETRPLATFLRSREPRQLIATDDVQILVSSDQDSVVNVHNWSPL